MGRDTEGEFCFQIKSSLPTFTLFSAIFLSYTKTFPSSCNVFLIGRYSANFIKQKHKSWKLKIFFPDLTDRLANHLVSFRLIV